MPEIIDVQSTVHAVAEEVWRLLGDSATWPEWTTIDTYRRVQSDVNGVGEIREFRTGRRIVTEQVVVKERPRQLSYVLLAGLAVRDYHAEVSLDQDGDVTTIRWHTEFRAKVPGTGWLYRRTLDAYTRRFVEGLKAHSEAASATVIDTTPGQPTD